MRFVVSLWCTDGPDLDLVGSVRTFVQRSREGIIPAFDLEELHGTMLIQGPDVVQGQPSLCPALFAPWLLTIFIQDCIYRRVTVYIFTNLSYFFLRHIMCTAPVRS